MLVGRLPVMGDVGQGLTVLERLMFHLHHVDPSGRGSQPEQQTQTGIASAIGIQRKHIPRALRRLVEEGWVNLVLKHVDGRRQRIRVHVLSEAGREEILRLREHHHDHTVDTDDGPVRVLDLIAEGRMDDLHAPGSRVKENDAAAGSRLASRAVAARMLGCTEDDITAIIEDSNGTEDGLPLILDGPEAVFLSCLDTALNDGVISEDEEALLTKLRKELGPFGAALNAHVASLLHDMMK